MEQKIQIAVFGGQEECTATEQLLTSIAEADGLSIQVKVFHDYDELRPCMETQRPNLFITLADGPMGMEAVYLVRLFDANLPVIWFSDDRGFAMQSHRLECAFFSVKPVALETMRRALYQACV